MVLTKTSYKLTEKHESSIRNTYVFLQGGCIGCGAKNIMYRLNNYIGHREEHFWDLINEMFRFKKKVLSNRHFFIRPSYLQYRTGKVEKYYNSCSISGQEIKVYTNKKNQRYIMCDKKRLYINRDDKYIYKPSTAGFETTIEDFDMI